MHKILIVMICFSLVACVSASPPSYTQSWKEKKSEWSEKPKEIKTVKTTSSDWGGNNIQSSSEWGGISQKKEADTKPQQVKSEIDINILNIPIKNPGAIAVIIGNRDYQNRDISSVDFAHNDAEAMKKYLTNVFGYSEENIIYESNASKTKFEAIFGTNDNYKGKLYNHLKKGKSDIFIYYSGHGAPDPNDKRAYFVPSDADPQALSLTGYPLQQLYDNISKIVRDKQAPNVFIVIDACFSGATEKGLFYKNMSPLVITGGENPLLSLSNAVVLTSASGTEISSWYPEKGHSMFTYFFLKAVKDKAGKSNATLTAEALFRFVSDESEGVPYYAARLYGRKQTPQITGDKNRVILSR